MRALHALFIVFSLTGFVLLWVMMALNGTLDAMAKAKEHSILPNGRSLKTTYTGIPPLDNFATTLVTFFDGVTNGSDPGPRLLMIDLCATLQTVLVTIMIESLRKGQLSRLLRLPAIWALMWNAVGGAVILPIFFLIQLQTSLPSDNRLPTNDAEALLGAILASYVPMILMLLPPLVEYSVDQHQTIIAIFQVAPLIFSAIQHALATLLASNPTRNRKPDKSKACVMRAYLLISACSAGAHGYAMLMALFSGAQAISLKRVYVPSPSSVDHASDERITEGAHLFLQYDYMIISLTCMLYTYLLLESRFKPKGYFRTYLTDLPMSEGKAAILFITLSTAVLGAGATVSLGLWAKERRSQREDISKCKST